MSHDQQTSQKPSLSACQQSPQKGLVLPLQLQLGQGLRHCQESAQTREHAAIQLRHGRWVQRKAARVVLSKVFVITVILPYLFPRSYKDGRPQHAAASWRACPHQQRGRSLLEATSGRIPLNHELSRTHPQSHWWLSLICFILVLLLSFCVCFYITGSLLSHIIIYLSRTPLVRNPVYQTKPVMSARFQGTRKRSALSWIYDSFIQDVVLDSNNSSNNNAHVN